MNEEDDRQHAEELFQRAYTHQMNGELDLAIDLYKQSIDLYPTAEAHTFLGWTYSFQQEYDKAIEECKIAIEIDPEFGNPYNDIGAYLIELGRPEEAIPWLKQATSAPRYENYCFPHYNLGRVYERLHQWDRAKECFRSALKYNPEYTPAKTGLRRIQALAN